MSSDIKVLPSILAADWSDLKKEIDSVTKAGADLLHLDVMDGSFVPPITYGQEFVRTVKKHSSIPLDVHLMISKPEYQIDSFIDAGADILTFHIEASSHPHRIIQRIKEKNVLAGIALNPGSPVSLIEPLLSELDLVLIMTVNPGWGGQSFINPTLNKISDLSNSSNVSDDLIIEVDGGINKETASECVSRGATYLVAGTYIFGSNNYSNSILNLKK